VVGNRLGRKGNGETQAIILKWIVEELLLSSALIKPKTPSETVLIPRISENDDDWKIQSYDCSGCPVWLQTLASAPREGN
jgi:hypothetical protein